MMSHPKNLHRSVSKDPKRRIDHHPPAVSKNRRRTNFAWASLFVVAAVLITQHPRASSIASDLLTPGDKFLSDLERWRNFTLSAHLRSVITDMFNVNQASLESELPFYFDVISQSNGTITRPIVFIPGYVTSGLEIWSSLPCAKAKFRERIWGTASMIKLFVTDSKCWIQHMLLKPVWNSNNTVHYTDPDGIRIKPTMGLSAADYVLGNYWVWNPIIEALGQAGYDETLMSMMSYDWRMSLRDLEYHSKYFSRLKLEVEKLYAINGKKRVMLISHSFGAKVWFFFIQWISQHHSPEWISKHIATTYNIGPVYLGVPKAISALLSGDTRDTAQLGALSTLLDTLMPPSDRSALTASWGSILDMRPMGGRGVWNNTMLYLEREGDREIFEYDLPSTISLLFNTSAMKPQSYHHAHSKIGSLRCPDQSKPLHCYKDDWVNPLVAPLPPVVNTTIWSAYGIGIPTEAAYHYVLNSGADMSDNSGYRINTTHTDGAKIFNGIVLDDGDGTVPARSLGYVPAIAWKSPKLNPASIPSYIRELPHGESYSVLSRATSVGGSSVDHVDIMGNRQVIRDILQLALGLEHLMDPPTQHSVVLALNLTHTSD
jgi:phospholipid:diacylglycerol acyltransferase